ncbi:MAG: AAA family ATPase [Vulcanibacillus sp.]
MDIENLTTNTKSHKIQIVIDQNKKVVKIKDNFEKNDKNLLVYNKFNLIIEDLNKLIGLEEIKKLIFEIFALIQINQQRTINGLKNEPQVFHMLFKGNPGTGKTTVARLMAKMFFEMGIISKGHLVEVERADLVGEYIGHTAQKTREQVNKSLGGILFIDEAYSLYRGGEKDFGRESIDTLVKAMEDHKNDFILVLAGYSSEMEFFIRSNPGLYSRFPIQLHFDDYSLTELMNISNVMLGDREYILSPSAKLKLKQIILEEKQNPLFNFSNARLVRNLIEKSIRNQAVRLLNDNIISSSKQELMTLQPEDFLLNRNSLEKWFK